MKKYPAIRKRGRTQAKDRAVPPAPEHTAADEAIASEQPMRAQGFHIIEQHNATGEMLHGALHVVGGLREVLMFRYGRTSQVAQDFTEILSSIRTMQSNMNAQVIEEFGDTPDAQAAYNCEERVKRFVI